MKLLTSRCLLTTKSLFAFESILCLELPHTLFQMKSVPVGRALAFLVLKSCLFPWAKSLSHKSGAGGGDSDHLLLQWHPCFVSSVRWALKPLAFSVYVFQGGSSALWTNRGEGHLGTSILSVPHLLLEHLLSEWELGGGREPPASQLYLSRV